MCVRKSVCVLGWSVLKARLIPNAPYLLSLHLYLRSVPHGGQTQLYYEFPFNTHSSISISCDRESVTALFLHRLKASGA